MPKQYYVYIVASKSFTLYVGMTNDLARRMFEHKNKLIEGFTSKYNINKLVYYEVFNNPIDAISVEKRIKGWARKKKIDLIKTINSNFEELNIQ